MLKKAVFRDFYHVFKCALFAPVFVVFSLFAAWAEEEPDYKFTLTTTTLPVENNTYVFEFQLSAAGTFYIDCDGGTLSGTGVSGNTVTRTSTTNETYKCVYQSSNARDIRFGGKATAYSDTGDTVHPNLFVATISFEISNTKVASISGDLSAVFPIKGSADSEKPKFKRTFAGCTNISSIPGNLFSSYESGGIAIFEETFIGCTGLTQIPSSLFANIETGATHMFKGTFSGCVNLGEIPENLFTSITSSGYKMYYETFYGCTNLTLPENFKFFGGTDISGAEYMFEETFYGCQSLTSLPAGMFSNITSGAKMMFFQTFINCTNLRTVPEGFKFINSNSSVSGQDSMFTGTFYGCQSLETVPSDVFGHISTGATWMFRDTFYNCSSLTTMPVNSFSGIISSAQYMFDGTFNGCSSLTGYIPIAMFKALIDHQSPYALDMMKNIFAGTNLATECPTGTTPYTTGYEEYWDGKVACQSGDGGYTYPFSVTVKPVTTSDRFTFTISAKGTFYVYCGDGGQLYGEDAAASTVSGITITKNNTDTYRYGCYFIGVNQRDVKFGGLATEYADDAAALSFNGSGGSLILSADGNLSSIFPYKGSADGQSPRFKEMFKSCSRLSSISANLFSGYTVGVSSMFEYTFQTCTSLTQIPESLFSSFTSGANSMFLGTFYGCSSLQSIPENLFSFGSTPNNPVYIDGANDMFLWTFLRCTEVQTIPAGLFAHIKSGALRMFSETFRECTGITSIPEDFKFGNDNMTSSQSMFVGTFKDCTGLTSLPSGMFSNIKTGSYNMFNRTFIGCTGLRYLPENLFANITTSANNMFGETFKDCTGFIANPSATNPAEKYNFIPPTMFKGLIDNYSTHTTNVMAGIFDGTTLSTACPEDIPQYITGYEDYWDSHVSCKPCSPGSHLLSGSRICGYDITYNCGKGSGSVPIGMTATDNTSFTPAENTCTPPTNAIFGGWLVSGTEDIKSAGDAFIWEYTENKTFTAQWYCDKSNNYWWDSVNNECALGYEIDLTQSSKTEWDNAPVPSKLYTIKNVGVYLDENRTQKMTASANRVQVPTVNSFVVKYDTNAPKNPVTGNKYESSSVENQTLSITYNGSGINNEWIDSDGYITEEGLQRALSLSDNESWPALDYVWESSDVRNAASLDNDGYVFEAWYDNPEGEGEEISQLSSDEHPEKLYAKWSSYNYYIRYYNYFCGRSGDWIVVGNGEEWFDIDQEITVAHPTLEGHVFQGWNITNMDSSEHYYSNSPIFIDGVYQTTTQTTNATSLNDMTETHFMNLRTTPGTVSFTADWACDVANYWHPTSDNTPADGNGPCTPCTNRYIIRYVVQDLPAPYSTYISSNYSDLQNAYQYATVGTENIDLIYNVPDVSVFTSYRYHYTPWVCTDNNGEIVPMSNNKILEMPPSAVTCTTTWECNGNYHMNTNGDSCVTDTVNLIWVANGQTYNENQNTCDYAVGTISGVSHPDIPGYTFTGWKVTNWE